MKGFTLATILVLLFKKEEIEDKIKYDNFNLRSKAEIIINESDVYNAFQLISTRTLTKIKKSLGKCSGWIIDSVIGNTISISRYIRLAECIYIKLPKELEHPRKGLINI